MDAVCNSLRLDFVPSPPSQSVSAVPTDNSNITFMNDEGSSWKAQEPSLHQRPLPSQGSDEPDSREETKLRATIAERMKGETVYCTNEDFIAHYLPPLPATINLEAIVSDVEKSGYLHKSTAHAQNPPGDLSIEPSQVQNETEANERTVFARLVNVVTAIRNSEAGTALKNAFDLQILHEKEFKSDLVRGCIFRIDACATAAKTAPEAIRLTDVVVPFEFKLTNTKETQQENRLQLVSAIVHIMNDDVRRNFMFGITIEDDRVSMWYFSRTHSVKATSFSYVKEPKKFVHFLAVLCCATEAQLGYDSRITLLPDESFLYEFPVTREGGPTSIKYTADKEFESAEEGSASAFSATCDSTTSTTVPGALYFRTTDPLSNSHALGVAGRTTRVFKCTQVVSKENPTPVPGAAGVAVKDVWVSGDGPTEVQIQAQLFDDIEKFVTSSEGWKKYPLLGDFNDDDTVAFGTWLPNAGYKDLFLCADRENVGGNSTAVHPRAWDSSDIFRGAVLTQDDAHFGSAHTGPSLPVTLPPLHPVPQANSPSHQRAFRPKKRCFYLFPDVCTKVTELPTLGVAMDVLRQTHLALMLMFCAGWVHRDISSGNVLALKEDQAWRVKLADLEYAQRFPSDDPGSTGPKIGTPYFMASEIQTSYSLYKTMRSTSRRTLQEIASQPSPAVTRSKVVKKHTYAHDLESLWWLILWILTNHLGDRESHKLAWGFFQGNDANGLERRVLLESGGIPIRHPQLSALVVPPLEVVRLALLEGYGYRDPRTDIEKVGDYAVECAVFNHFFKSIGGEEGRQSMASLALYPAGEFILDDVGVEGEARVEGRTKEVEKKRKVGPQVEDDDCQWGASAGPAKKGRT